MDPSPEKGLLLAAAFFVTAPSLAEQYAYTLQAFEITLSMCICMIAVYCAGRAVYGNGSVIWYLAAVLLLVWTLGSYQGFWYPTGYHFYYRIYLIFPYSFIFVQDQRRGLQLCGCHVYVGHLK